jgi:FMN phosphatase YigB (HAD superfamily)
LTSLYRELITAEQTHSSFLDPQPLLDVCLDRDSFHFLCSARPRIRAIIFDLYGTLLIAPPGRIRPDPQVDPALREVIAGLGFHPPASPTTALDHVVRRHHLASDDPHPEVDLRELWRDLLKLPADVDMTDLVIATERVRLPTSVMPGAEAMLHTIADAGLPMGILSNAQCNALHELGNVAMRFEPRLTVLSHQHGIAKPSPALFTLLATRLSEFGIHPEETLIVGNDPLHDITPAQEQGFQTALFTGHPDSHRPGIAQPDLTLTSWTCLTQALGLADPTATGKPF